MLSIIVIGYYFRNNFGDDLFQYVFQNYIFKEEQLTFVNFDDIKSISHWNYDMIVIGGGDVINDYFFNSTNWNILKQQSAPIIFYSIGATYQEFVYPLDIGDQFFFRNLADYDKFKSMYSSNYVEFTPDIAFLLDYEIKERESNSIKKIGICVPASSLNCVIELARALSNTYEVFFIPFDTSASESNSDLVALNKLKDKNFGPNVHFILEKQSIEQMLNMFSELDIVIAGRFHSVLLSMITGIPFIAVYKTPKIDKLRQEMNSVLQPLFVEIKDNTISIDSVLKKLDYVIGSFTEIKESLCNVKDRYNDLAKSTIKNIKIRKRYGPPQTCDKQLIIDTTLMQLGKMLQRNVSHKDIRKLRSNIPINNVFSLRGKNVAFHLAQEILWQISKDPFAPYLYGLAENVCTKGLYSQLDWLIDDYYSRYHFRNINKNIDYVNLNFQEVHRSGWQYVVDNIILELNTKQRTNKLVIDTYVDKTFHWNSQFYKSKGVIPYKNDWIGFIHHTFSPYNNVYNCDLLFQDKTFQESLQHCKALIVLSEYLKTEIIEKTSTNVPIYVVTHPTEIVVKQFSWNNFQNNKQKQVIQIGNWLRNMFSIYAIELPTTSIISNKGVLRNRNSDNYFLPNDFYSQLENVFSVTLQNQEICRISMQNMHLKGMYEYIVYLENSVSTIDFLDDSQYDDLLSNNIIFINLVDASAVNTVIECILRSTPLLVNPHPAVKEMLGESYPLYYTSLYEASRLLDDTNALKNGHEYLYNLNKDQFKITSFLSDLGRILDLIS